jgi:membrane fusion protein (multidrug efflux system)
VIRSKEITIKGEMPDLYVVNSGITVDDKILFDGIQKANDNDKIKYDYLDPKKVLSSLRLKAE